MRITPERPFIQQIVFKLQIIIFIEMQKWFKPLWIFSFKVLSDNLLVHEPNTNDSTKIDVKFTVDIKVIYNERTL